MDNLFEQFTNISKAHAYDIVSNKLGEVEEQNKNFRKSINDVLDQLTKTPVEEIIKSPADLLIRIGNICNHVLRTNKPL